MAGQVEPKRANSALYAIATAGRALEIEVAERLDHRLSEIQRAAELPVSPLLIDGRAVEVLS